MLSKALLLALAAAPLSLAQYDYSTPSAAAATAATSPSATASSSSSAPTISVGAGGLTFSPSSVTVPVGGQVVFSFAAFSAGHSATQADFAAPCAPAAGGANGSTPFNSGLVSQGGQTFVVDVASSDPMWFYCGQVSHCQGGMVGVINPP
jgi:plastocyanin